MSTLRNSGSQPWRERRVARVASAIGTAALAGALAILAACADSPSAPRAAFTAAAPALAKGGQTPTSAATAPATAPTHVTPLVRDVPLRADLTKSFAVTSAHAILDWPEVGLRINVPANAVPAGGMTITVTALQGGVVAYDFGPDGSKFPVPLVLMQSTTGTNFARIASTAGTAGFEGAYFRSRTQIDGANHTATVDEFQPTKVDRNGAWVQFEVTHFSGYMVSTGRQSGSAAE